MAVIKVNGRVIEVPEVFLAYASKSFFMGELHEKLIGELNIKDFGLEDRLHGLRIDDKSVAGFHNIKMNDSPVGRFDVDVLFPGFHVSDDDSNFSFAYLVRGQPVLIKEDGSDFVVDVDPYYDIDQKSLQLLAVKRTGLHKTLGLDGIEKAVKIYDRDGAFIGLVDRDKLSKEVGVNSDSIENVGNCKINPLSSFFGDLFSTGFGLSGFININQGKNPLRVSGAIYKPGEALLNLDYAKQVLGLRFREEALADPKTIVTSPHPDVKHGETRGGKINADMRRVPEVGNEQSVIVEPEFRDTVEGAYDIHGVPRFVNGVEVYAQVILGGAEEPSGVEIPLDAEFEIPVGGDAAIREFGGTGQDVQTGVVLSHSEPNLEERVKSEIESLLDDKGYFMALSIAQKNLPSMVHNIVSDGIFYFVKIKDYGNAVEMARKSEPEYLRYACVSVCDDALSDKKYSVAITYADMINDPKYLDIIKEEVLQRLSREGNYAGAADILLLLGDRKGALSKLEEGRVFSRAIRLAEDLDENEKANLLRKRARFLGDTRLYLENLLESSVVPRLMGFAGSVGGMFSALYEGTVDAAGNIGSLARPFFVSVASEIGKSVGRNLGSVNWNKVRRPAAALGFGLLVGYGAYNFLTLPSQTKDEKEAWESAKELRQKEDLDGAVIYAKRAQNAMSWYERFVYEIPGVDSDYEDFASGVLAEKKKKLAEKDMLVDYPVSTDDLEWLNGLLSGGPIVSVQPIQPKKVDKKIKVFGLEGVTKRLGAYFGLSFREGDPYTSNFESEVRKQYESYVSAHGGINSGSFRFVYVVNNGTISKAVLVRDGDGDALKFGKSLLGLVRGKNVGAHDGVYASKLYKFGGK